MNWLIEFLQFWQFLRLAARGYKMAKHGGTHYSALVVYPHQIPKVAFFIGRDREAWRVINLAIESGATKTYPRI